MERSADKYIINGKEFSLFMRKSEIDSIVSELAERINSDYRGKTLTCVLVMKGSIFFGADILRELTLDCRLEILRTSSYGSAMESSGEVSISMADINIKGKDVLIIEDIVDSGRTLKSLMETLNSMLPNSLEAVSFLSKPDKREVSVAVKYIGKEIPPVFVVGYGLDYDEQGRCLPNIYAYG
jgi:hypoxanthine phosphoribosyltransferase